MSNTPSSNQIIDCKQVSKNFRDGDLEITVVTEMNLTINAGDQLAIIGSSGSGKSTLLHILGGLSKPSTGEVFIAGEDINKLSANAQGKLRNSTLGFVYQFHHLLVEFSALENVAMPLLIQKNSEAFDRAEQVLKRVGLGHRLTHKPGELSGGERQRAAIARALVTQPSCILADEPTGNLDKKTAESVFDLLLEMNQEFNTSLVMVTHDMLLADNMASIVSIDNGRLIKYKE